MNELQVKTIEIKPAVIEFNHEDIEKELESSLKKYEGLVFTEDTATDLRKTLAELRKGKNAVDRYRIDTKKKLNEPVTEFEKKCKQLDKYFNDVITPLTEQQKEFEDKRRAEKLAQLEKIRLEHIVNYGLDEEYHAQVAIDDSTLPKSTSLKQAGESIEFQVKNLKMEQDKKAADKELIITSVKLANSLCDLEFSADAYVRLLEYQEVETIKQQIDFDAEAAVQKREREQAEKEKKEQERVEREKQAELERIKVEAEKKLAAERDYKEEFEKVQKVVEENTFEEVPLSNAPESESIDDEIPFADDPFAVDPFKESSPMFRTFSVFATKEELDSLESHMKEIGIDFEVINK